MDQNQHIDDLKRELEWLQHNHCDLLADGASAGTARDSWQAVRFALAGIESELRNPQLARRIVANAGRGRPRAPRWVHVKNATALGSTAAAELCRAAGFEPDEEIGARS